MYQLGLNWLVQTGRTLVDQGGPTAGNLITLSAGNIISLCRFTFGQYMYDLSIVAWFRWKCSIKDWFPKNLLFYLTFHGTWRGNKFKTSGKKMIRRKSEESVSSHWFESPLRKSNNPTFLTWLLEDDHVILPMVFPSFAPNNSPY